MTKRAPKNDILPVQKASGKATVKKSRHLPVKQPHGGALIPGQGGGRENGLKGGRPPSELRDRLRGTLQERVPIIEQIADGVPVKNADIPLAAVLKHATCPLCDGKLRLLETTKPEDVLLISLRGKESASPGDRIKALDLAAKYGLGTKEEITLVSPDVRARVESTVALISTRPTWDAVDLLAELDKVWS